MMWRVMVVVAAAAWLPGPSLARRHTLEAPHRQPPAPPLHLLAATDGADSESLPTPGNEADSEGSASYSSQFTRGTQPPGPGRTKRWSYDYGTPWERRVYGRRQTQNHRGRLNRYRNHRYPYGRRRQHHNYRGPDYGDFYHESSHKYNHAGYVETSDTKFSPKTVSFAHAKASGVLRTSSTGGDAEGSG